MQRAQQLLDSALSLQQAGSLQAAENLYRRALAMAPNHFDGLHMLGVICYQTGRLWKAFDLIKRALDLTEWQIVAMRYNMGLVVAQLMRDPAPDMGERDIPGERRAALRAAREKLSALARNVQQYEVSDDLDPLCVTRVQMPRVSIVIPAFDRHIHARMYPQHCPAYGTGPIRDHSRRRCVG